MKNLFLEKSRKTDEKRFFEQGVISNALASFVTFTVLMLLFAYWVQEFSETQRTSSKPIACSQEAKLCPNGSSVARMGPNCEFTSCFYAKEDIIFGESAEALRSAASGNMHIYNKAWMPHKR